MTLAGPRESTIATAIALVWYFAAISERPGVGRAGQPPRRSRRVWTS